MINLRVQAVGVTDRPRYAEEPFAGEDASAARKGERNAYLPEENAFGKVAVYDGHRMHYGNYIVGPAIIEEETTAIFVSASYDCVVDRLGSFALHQKGREDLVTRAREEALA